MRNEKQSERSGRPRRGRIGARDRLRFLLCCIAIIALARPLWHWGRSSWTRINAARDWRECRASENYRPRIGEPCAWLRIEAAGIDSIVLRGDTKPNLARAPAMHDDTGALTLLSAHRDKHFRNIGRLQPGDAIELERVDGTCLLYRVAASEVVAPDEAVKLIDSQGNSERLLLMTCYPFEFIGPAPQRYLLWADKEE